MLFYFNGLWKLTWLLRMIPPLTPPLKPRGEDRIEYAVIYSFLAGTHTAKRTTYHDIKMCVLVNFANHPWRLFACQVSRFLRCDQETALTPPLKPRGEDRIEHVVIYSFLTGTHTARRTTYHDIKVSVLVNFDDIKMCVLVIFSS